MNKEVVLPVLDIGIKYAVLVFCSYYIFMRSIQKKPAASKYLHTLLLACGIGGTLIWLKTIINPLHVILMLLYLVVTDYFLFRHDINVTIILSGLSFAVSHAVFLVLGFIDSVILVFLYWDDEKGEENSIYDFLNDIPAHIISYTITLALLFGIVYLTMRSKRICNGMLSIVRFGSGGTGIMIMIMLLLFSMGIGLPADTPARQVIRTVFFCLSMVMCVTVVYWIKKEISTVYLKLLLDKTSALTESTIAGKDKLIEELRRDNERLAAIIRKDGEILPEMIRSVRQSAASIQSGSGEATEMIRSAKRLEEIYGERMVTLSEYESRGDLLTGTGVKAVDNVLHYMADRSESSGVRFAVDVEADVAQMLQGTVDSREFNTMLADLAENAIISAKQHLPGTVAVNFRQDEGSYCLEVLDSGDKFNAEVLRNMGIRQTTTHKGEGGSGIGLMTLIKIIKHNNASLTIEEYPEGEKYSKAVRVSFDRKSRFRISTYRADELRSALKHNRFSVESRQPTLR